jgi:hypothetical protein
VGLLAERGETKMNELSINIVHGLLATILALGPLSIALYFDLKQKREAKQKNG